MKYRFTGRARLEIERNDRWWRANRSAAPTLFLEELIAAIEQTVNHPELGKTYRDAVRPGVRYVILPRAQRKLYYLCRDDEVVFLAVWGGRRRRGPKL